MVKMGLEGKENMVPCELSGGQQQRRGIARALALNPDVLFFDEPTSALDPELTKGVLKVIRDLADEHMTMVIVTHEMSFARDVADHIIFMDGGYIVEEGPAEQVINNPQQERTKLFRWRTTGINETVCGAQNALARESARVSGRFCMGKAETWKRKTLGTYSRQEALAGCRQPLRAPRRALRALRMSRSLPLRLGGSSRRL